MPPADPARPRADTFAARAKREADRFRLATDSEYWIAFCFRTQAARDAFARAVKARPDHRVAGQALPQKPPGTITAASRAMRMLMARSTRGLDTTAILNAKPAPDPFAAAPQGDDLEHDSASELDTLLAALTAPPDPVPANVLDSPWHVIAWWPSRDDKDAWLAATGCDVLGDKHVDGHQAASTLGIRL